MKTIGTLKIIGSIRLISYLKVFLQIYDIAYEFSLKIWENEVFFTMITYFDYKVFDFVHTLKHHYSSTLFNFDTQCEPQIYHTAEIETILQHRLYDKFYLCCFGSKLHPLC